MIQMIASRAVLEQALADLDHAAEKGYEHCVVILKIVSAGDSISDTVVGYDRQILLKAHPTNGSFDWGNTTLYYDTPGMEHMALVQLDEKTLERARKAGAEPVKKRDRKGFGPPRII